MEKSIPEIIKIKLTVNVQYLLQILGGGSEILILFFKRK